MKFIYLTQASSGNDIYINFHLVRDISESEKGTVISFDAEYYYVVRETVQEILKKIKHDNIN